MICTLTARRVKPGAYEHFRAAWDPATPTQTCWRAVYHGRDVSDPEMVISFGLFDGSLEDLRAAQNSLGRTDQVDRSAPHAQQVLLDGSYEIVEEPNP